MPRWSSKFGILPDKKGIVPWRRCTIEGRQRPLLFMISPTPTVLRVPSHGWKNCNGGGIRTWSLPWWVMKYYFDIGAERYAWIFSIKYSHPHHPLYLRLETKPTSRHVAKWTLTRQTNTQRRTEFCTWKRQQRMRIMWRRYLWKLPSSYRRRRSNLTGRLSLFCRRSRSREIAAESVGLVEFYVYLYCCWWGRFIEFSEGGSNVEGHK